MRPTEVLKHEHQIILKILGRAEQLAEPEATIDTRELAEIVDFIRTFADRCHHGKEEKHLFALMAERGFSLEFGPLAVMMAEHEQGRSYVRAMAGALEKAQAGGELDAPTVKKNLAAYAELLRGHIYKEDNVLYAMADTTFTPEDQQALAEAFERVEAEMGEGTHEKYHALAHRLETEHPPTSDPNRTGGTPSCLSFCH